MVRFLSILMMIFPGLGCAQTVIAVQTLRPGEVISETSVTLNPKTIAGAYQSLDEVLGQEVRFAIYAGRPVGVGDIGAPALVRRNQIVEIRFTRAGLSISVEGRALARGGAGERVRVMNLSSRNSIFATVAGSGIVIVE